VRPVARRAIAANADEAGRPAGGVAPQTDGVLDHALGAGVILKRVLEPRERFARLDDAPERGVGDRGAFVAAEDIAIVRADEIGGRTADKPAVGIVDADVDALQVELEIAVFETVDDLL
jgi:hypothetical protein